MFVIFSTLFFAIYGGLRARKLGGQKFDVIQYAVGFAIAGFTISMILTVLMAGMV